MNEMIKTLSLKEALATLNLPGLDANLFSSSDWLDVIVKTYHVRLFVKYIERNNQIDGYIIYSLVDNILEWKICICSYCDYFDCYVKSASDWHLFFESLRRDYPKYRIAIRNLRDEAVRACPDFKVLSQERYHMMDLRADVDTLWRDLYPNFKGACKSAQKAGVVIKRCGKEHLKDFFRMHLNLRKNKYRLFPQPYKFFDIIWRQYMDHDKGVLLGAFNPQGEMIGANVYLICGNTLYYKFSTSRQDALHLRPSNILIWEGIKFAKERELQYLDMGSSGYEQNSLIWFKSHILPTTTMMDITHLGYAPPHYKFSQKRLLKFMTHFFTMPWMPEFMVRLGSNIIYHYLA